MGLLVPYPNLATTHIYCKFFDQRRLGDEALLNRFNPDPTGEGMGEVIVAVEIKLTKPVR